MTNASDYIKNLLIQENDEGAISEVLNKYFEERDNENSEIINDGNYYVIDPFPFLLFSNGGNKISNKMVEYCKLAYEDYQKCKGRFRSIYFLPPYIKGVSQTSIFTIITRAYIRDGLIRKVDGHEYIEKFYGLLDEVTSADGENYVFTKLHSWNELKNDVASKPANRLVIPGNMGDGTGYSTIKDSTGNLLCISNVNMEYQTTILPAMELINKASKDFNTNKSQIEPKQVGDITPFEKYISYLISNIALNIDLSERTVSNVKTGKSTNPKELGSIAGKGRKLDTAQYKNTRLTPQDNNIEYWKDSFLGDEFKTIDDNLSSTLNKSDWEKVKDDLSHTFDRKKLDNDLEKIYNLNHLIPDVLGLETDATRYDARNYEDPTRSKIKGVSGYDIYRHDKKIKDLVDRNKELRDKIATETDEKKIEKLQKEIEANDEEIDIIQQKIQSKEFDAKRNDKKYKDKVAKLDTSESVSASDGIKAVVFVTEHSKDIRGIEEYLNRS